MPTLTVGNNRRFAALAISLLALGIAGFAFAANSLETSARPAISSPEISPETLSPRGPAGGLLIPASCPSYEHYPGECTSSTCGNGVCDSGETSSSCPSDCPVSCTETWGACGSCADSRYQSHTKTDCTTECVQTDYCTWNQCQSGVCGQQGGGNGRADECSPLGSVCGGGRCGDGIVQTGESCDGGNLNGQSCSSQGFTSGSLSCTSSCTFNIFACYTTSPTRSLTIKSLLNGQNQPGTYMEGTVYAPQLYPWPDSRQYLWNFWALYTPWGGDASGLPTGWYWFHWDWGTPYPGSWFTGITPSDNQYLDTYSDLVYNFNFSIRPGNITFNATNNGAPWTGSISGRMDAVTQNVYGYPFTLTVPYSNATFLPDTYRLYYFSGGPPGATFTGITPSYSQYLGQGGNITFTYNFYTPLSAPSLSASTYCSGTSPRTSLSWSSSTGNPSDYHIQRCTGSTCTPTSEITVTAGTTYTDSNVANNTAYSYRIMPHRHSDGATNYSNVPRVTTPICTPAPTADIRANGYNAAATVTYNTAATITWSSLNAASCSVSPTGWTGTSGSQSTGALTAPRTYTLTCTDSYGRTGSDSVTVSIANAPPTASGGGARGGGISVPPGSGVNTGTPAFGESPAGACLLPRQPLFSWTYSDPESNPESAYEIQIDTDSGFVSPLTWDSGWVSSASNSAVVPAGTLAYNATYYWRVRVRDSLGAESLWSNGATFSTQAHQAPSVSYAIAPSPTKVSQQTTFTDQSTFFGGASVQRRTWSFGSGGTSADPPQNATQRVTYSSASPPPKDTSLIALDSANISCGAQRQLTVNPGQGVPNFKEVPPDQ